MNSNRKGFAHLILIIGVVLLGIAGIGYLLVKNGQIKLSPQKDTITQTATPTPPSDEIDTSNWKTYRNEEYGLEFKYPQDWEIDTSSSSFLFVLTPPEEKSGGKIELIAIDYSKTPPLPVNYTYKVLRTFQVDAIQIEVKSREPSAVTEKYIAEVKKDNMVYEFRFSLDNRYEKIFDQILSTFRFLDSKQSSTTDLDLQVWWGQINERQNFYVVVDKEFEDIPTSIEFEDNETNAKFGPYTISKISEDNICPQLITNHWDVYRTDDFPGFDSFDYTRLITVNLMDPDGSATTELTNPPGVCQSAAY